MLLHQTRTFFLQIGDLLIDIFDFMLDVIVMLLQNFSRFFDIRYGKRGGDGYLHARHEPTAGGGYGRSVQLSWCTVGRP